MRSIYELLSEIDVRENELYSSDIKPERVFDEMGNIKRVVTAKSSIVILSDNNEMWSPVLYQSCMNPALKKIIPVEAEALDNNTLLIKNKYGEKIVDIKRSEIKILKWVYKKENSDCRYCKNCGRCSW